MTDKNGSYAIRKGIFPFYKYFDLETPGYWWSKNSRHYTCCWTVQRRKVELWYGILNPSVAIIILSSNDKSAEYFDHEKERTMRGWIFR